MYHVLLMLYCWMQKANSNTHLLGGTELSLYSAPFLKTPTVYRPIDSILQFASLDDRGGS